MRVMGSDEPRRVETFEERGRRHARLARNALRDCRDNPDGTSAEFWEWDELTFPCDLPEGEIEELFDELWYAHERGSMPDAEWRADVDAALLDLMEVVA